MKYTKPQLVGYSAMAAIQSFDAEKRSDSAEGNLDKTPPAYIADE